MNKNIKYIIENKFNFNPVDYSDEDSIIIDNQTVSNLTYKYFPETQDELAEIVRIKLKENLEEPYLNDIDTSKITEMGYLFQPLNIQDSISARKIKKLDLSAWNMSNVKSMVGFFDTCYSVKKIILSNWDTSKVTNMSRVFQGCHSLTELDLSRWNTSNVTNMFAMFADCHNLIELNLSDWDVSNVEDMEHVFSNCSSLTKLNLSGWDISNVRYMGSMFYNCKKSIIPDWYIY